MDWKKELKSKWLLCLNWLHLLSLRAVIRTQQQSLQAQFVPSDLQTHRKLVSRTIVFIEIKQYRKGYWKDIRVTRWCIAEKFCNLIECISDLIGGKMEDERKDVTVMLARGSFVSPAQKENQHNRKNYWISITTKKERKSPKYFFSFRSSFGPSFWFLLGRNNRL